MFRIYVHNKPVFLIDNMTKEVQDYLVNPATLFSDEFTTSAIDALLQKMENDKVSAGIFQHTNARELLDVFKSHLTLIQASGGLVYTPDSDVLLIFRKGKWDLPKGKVEQDEEFKDCAVREIHEETGLEQTEIVKPLIVTYHTYYERERHILKESHWYLLKSQQAAPLTPQTEEDIEKCVWVPAVQLASYRLNMHASIIDVMNEGLKQITGED